MPSDSAGRGARLGALAGAVVALLGAGVLVLWAAHLGPATRIQPPWPYVRPFTALGLLLAGSSLGLLALPGSRGRRWLGRALAVLLGAWGLWLLVGYGLSPPGPLHILAWQLPLAVRPSITSSLGICLFSAALLLMDAHTRSGHGPGQYLAFGLLALCALALTGYLYGVPLLYAIPGLKQDPGLALITALAFCALALGALVARPQWLPISALNSPRLGGVAARRLLPVTLLLPGLDFLATLGQRAGLYDRAIQQGLVTVTGMALATFVVFATAAGLNGIDEERERAAEAQRRLAVLVQSSDDAIIGANRDLVITTWNPGAERMYGYKAEEVLWRPEVNRALYTPDSQASRDRLATELLAGKGVHNVEVVARRKDGSLFNASITSSPVFDEGQLVGVASIVRDISERVRTERALRESEERWRALFREASEAIFIANLEGRYTDVNPAACRLLGVAREQLLGRAITDVIPPDEIPRLGQSRAQLLEGSVQVGRWRLRRGDGSYVPVEVSAVILPDGRWVAFVRDMTEQVELERLREEWASVIAHDLRQPVNVISLTASALLRASPELMPRLAEKIRASAQRLNRMVGDLLDLSRLEAHRLSVEHEPLDLMAVVTNAAENAEALAPGQAVEIRSDGIPALVDGDAGRLEQVLNNLLSNATKYGDAGAPVLVSVRWGEQSVTVSVVNRGRGIPKEEFGRLFQRFSRSSTSRESGVEGVGLGLYLTRGLVEAHGGRIWAESTPGEATAFRFTLPVRPSAPEHAEGSGGPPAHA